MNTLTAIEAERVNQILKHAIDRLQILSYVPTAWDDDIVVDIKCQPVLNSLERLWMCEEQLKELDANMQMGINEGGVKDINTLKQLHRVCRATCRNFIADRPSLQTVMGRPELQSDDFSKFIRYLNELRSQVMQKLTTTVEDEAANRTLLHDLTERERHYEESRDVLQAKLNELRHEREHVSAGLDQTLRKLQHELQEITQHNNFEIESVQKEMNEAINKATADHELKMRQLQDRVDGLERQVNEVIEKNKEEEQRMRREKSRMENALNAKIAQYDEDMESRQKILDDLNKSFATESAEYALLKEHFDKIDADISRHNEEDALIAAVKRRELFGHFVLAQAAAKIQARCRGIIARAIVAKMKSKSKKGKKGKKGKK